MFLKLFLFVLLLKLSKCAENITKRSTGSTDVECGVPHSLVGFVFNGETADRHEFPWKVALFKRRNGKSTYSCGGVLISANHVVTAAHCIQNKNENSPTLVRDLRIILGAFDFNDQLEEGRVSSGVKKYKMHDNWNPSNIEFGGDIAVLELTNRVLFNEYVRPVCLPEVRVTDIKSGTIAGWGYFDNSQKVSNVPRKVDLLIVPDGQCFRDDQRLLRISSPEAFCAGKRGVGVCPGDSGSGLYVVKDKKFYVRGVVSSAAVDQCSDGYLALYSDISKYLDFIRDFMYGGSSTANLNCLDHGYAYCCVLKDFVIKSANTQISNLRTTHEPGKSSSNVKFLHFWVKNTDYLPNFLDGLMAQTLPNLEAYVVEGFVRGNTNMESNNINLRNTLKRENFRGFSKIKRLGINYCNIEILNEDVFYELIGLENLNLHSNNIRQLPAKLLIKNPKLNVLQAQNNAIETIPANFFDSNPKLWYVEFKNNKLKKIGVEFKKFNNLHKVHLQGNICIDEIFEVEKLSRKSELDKINQKCK